MVSFLNFFVDDDPNWFANLSTNAKTKEEFMEKSCQVPLKIMKL